MRAEWTRAWLLDQSVEKHWFHNKLEDESTTELNKNVNVGDFDTHVRELSSSERPEIIVGPVVCARAVRMSRSADGMTGIGAWV